VTTAALPSSGGIVLAQMLGILGGFDLERLDPLARTRVIIETMRAAYRERAYHLGDPDHVRVDLARLLGAAHLAELRAGVARRVRASLARPTAPADRPPAAAAQSEDLRQTTHFSVLDREGNRVAATLSINTPFGSGFVPPGTGVLLNNEMDDFVAKPGVPNADGLEGGEANAIAPGKRPLSSMTPSFLESETAVVILGTPGGSRIISMVLLATLEIAHGRGGPRAWVARPRFHHQYLPDEVQHEPGAFAPDVARGLTAAGYRLRTVEPYGNMQIVLWDKRRGRVTAAADPRGEGAGIVR
jgi:gamma-glutamyltranspeptidase/glutathione hydrolase